MAEQIQASMGRKRILAFRLLKDEKTASGKKLALQVEHNLKYERNSESKQTKDGAIAISGGLTVTLELSAVASNDSVNKMLMDSVINGDKLEIWEIDLNSKTTEGKYNALYMQGNLKSWELPAPTEGTIEFSTSVDIDGVPKAGPATLTSEQEAQIDYAFRDVTPVPGV